MTDDAGTARLVAIGEPVEGVDPLLIGSLAETVAAAMAYPPDARAGLAISTEGRVYGADEFAALQAGLHQDPSQPAG